MEVGWMLSITTASMRWVLGDAGILILILRGCGSLSRVVDGYTATQASPLASTPLSLWSSACDSVIPDN